MPDTPANDLTQRNLYCVLAQHGLGLHNSGRTYLCCQSRKYLEDKQGEQIYLDTHTVKDAWHSPTRREIQQALDAGIEHPNCEACWDDERAGKQSRRQYHNKTQHFIQEDLDQPQIFDLKMGNVCNMRCRTCNPEVSSQWYREDWELTANPQENISFKDYLVRWRRISASFDDENHDLWETMRQWIPNAAYIDYYGAEPMLIKKNFEVLQHAVDRGTAQNIDLHFSTNGTIWTPEIENLLSKFKKVYFDLSIDDIGDRCGYIRYPSTWNQMRANLDKFISASRIHSNFKFGVCITINNFNIYYLDEIFDFFAGLNLQTNYNFLHLPWRLNIKVLPKEVKMKVFEKLDAYRPRDSHDVWFHRYWAAHLAVLENFIMTEVSSQERYLQEFHYYTRGLDKIRNQCFETALPEFANLIGPWFYDLDQTTTGLSGLSDPLG